MHSHQNRFVGLDHLRALAITMVFVFHYGAIFKHPQLIRDISTFGWTGVDLFFVLSGFLMASQLFKKMAAGKNISIGEFYFKRFFRIIPVYAVIVSLYYLIPPFREFPTIQPLWRALTFTQNLWLDRSVNRAFTHSWSLCVEEQFYLILPLILAVYISLKWKMKGFHILLTIFILGLILRIYSWYYLVPSVDSSSFNSQWAKWIYYPSYTRLDGLLAGIAIAALFQYMPKQVSYLLKKRNLVLMMAIIMIIVSYLITINDTSLFVTVIGFPIVDYSFGLLVLASLLPGSIISKYPNRVTSFIANLSYAIYLSHKGIIHLTQQYFVKYGIADDSFTMMFICVINCVLGAMVLNILIEKPFLKWRKHLLSKWQSRKSIQFINVSA